MDEGGLGNLAEALGNLIMKGLGTRSAWALETALRAAETEGITGVCVVQIPAKNKDYAEITFTVGTVDVVSRWGVGA